LLSRDVTGRPLIPEDGWLVPRRVEPDLLVGAARA
jgi:hypothetical protein